MNFDRLIREEARLIILKALAEQVDSRLNSALLVDWLSTFGITCDRPFVHAEFDHLKNVGAITVTSVGTVQVAGLTERGRKHLERAVALDGVKRPSLPEV